MNDGRGKRRRGGRYRIIIRLQLRVGDSVYKGGAGKTEKPSFHNVIIITIHQIQLYNQESEYEINHILAFAN